LILALPTLDQSALPTASAPLMSVTLALHAVLMVFALSNAWATPSSMAQAALVKFKLLDALSIASALPQLTTLKDAAFPADAHSLATLVSTHLAQLALLKTKSAATSPAPMFKVVTQYVLMASALLAAKLNSASSNTATPITPSANASTPPLTSTLAELPETFALLHTTERERHSALKDDAVFHATDLPRSNPVKAMLTAPKYLQPRSNRLEELATSLESSSFRKPLSLFPSPFQVQRSLEVGLRSCV